MGAVRLYRSILLYDSFLNASCTPYALIDTVHTYFVYIPECRSENRLDEILVDDGRGTDRPLRVQMPSHVVHRDEEHIKTRVTDDVAM